MPKIEKTKVEIRFMSAGDWGCDMRNAWLFSRPKLTMEQINSEEIAKFNSQLADFGRVHVQIVAPILFREIFVMDRTNSIWARSSRADNIDDVWPITEYVDDDSMSEISKLALIFERSKSNKAQDQYRMGLPLGYMTSLSVYFSPRSLVRMISTMEFLAAQRQNVSKVAADIAAGLTDIAIRIGLPVLYMLKSIDRVPFINAIPYEQMNIEQPKFATFGNHILMRLYTTLALRAQLIRHRNLSVVDNLSSHFNDHERIFAKTISTPIYMEVSGDKSSWEHVVGNRSCWIAQNDIWENIINEYTKAVDGGIPKLPCNNGQCPFLLDNNLRIAGKDPNPPCPRAISLSPRSMLESKFDADTLLKMQSKYVKETGRPKKYWHDQMEAMTKSIGG